MKFERPFDGEKYLEIGNVQSHSGRLEFWLAVHADGSAHVTLCGSDPSDRRKAGVIVRLTGSEYQKLWKLLQKTDDAIAEAKATGQMTGLASHG